MNKAQKLSFYDKLEKLDVLYYSRCTKDEVAEYMELSPDDLPDDVFLISREGISSYVRHPSYTDAEIGMLIALESLQNIRTIKRCVKFFTVLFIASVSIYLLVILYNLHISMAR